MFQVRITATSIMLICFVGMNACGDEKTVTEVLSAIQLAKS